MTKEEEIMFFNKELADIVRDLVKNSPVTMQEAMFYLKTSNDFDRDAFIIRKLSSAGVSIHQIKNIISLLNT